MIWGINYEIKTAKKSENIEKLETTTTICWLTEICTVDKNKICNTFYEHKYIITYLGEICQRKEINDWFNIIEAENKNENEVRICRQLVCGSENWKKKKLHINLKK